MKKCYLVFDQLPSIRDGGLLATYVNILPYFEKKYEVHIVSIFNFRKEIKEENVFKNHKIHILNDIVIDNRFFHLFQYMKKGEWKAVVWALYSFLIYFSSSFCVRLKIRSLIGDDDLVFVSSPAAAMFMSSKTPFILDIHTKYEYFFGSNLIGRLQTMLMRKPVLTVFRNENDARIAQKKFNSEYIYNFVSREISMENSKKEIKRKILFVGRLHEHKDPLKLIDCAYELKNLGGQFTLDIYGNGPLEMELKQKIIDLNLQDYVYLRGFLTDKRIYSNYDVLWLTSKLEGFPLVVVEAKANRVPAISINWGEAVYELIHHGEDGYIATDHQEIAKYTFELLNDSGKAIAFSEKAYNDYKTRFTEACYFKKLDEIISIFDRLK